ncbi:MAG: SRPBCC family protein [Clostridia bacterium]|nr:SRPBCC family protein [Deltaproteobacteria bacterium]
MKKHKHKKHLHYTPAGQEPIAIRFGHLFWALAHRLTRGVVRPKAFKQTLVVARPPKDVYAFWRDFKNLAEVSNHIDSIEATGEGKTRWVLNAPFGLQLSWNAEITADEVKRRIAWKTTAPADIPHTGQVIFHGINDGQHTELAVSVDYYMPLGPVGDILGKLLGGGGGAQSLIEAEMDRFKVAVEGVANTEASGDGDVAASPDSNPTSELLREARDIETGGAISHPEHIHAADNEVVVETKVEIPGNVIAAKKHHKHAPVSDATAVVTDHRTNLRNHH